MTKGPLIIVSGPSGVGKSTIIRKLLERKDFPLRLSVSATTRQARQGEQDGVDYHFWTTERFEKGIEAGVFLEWARVVGNYYGTPRQEVEPVREQGVGVILDIDVQGWDQVRGTCPDHVSIFLLAPSMEVYEQRLRDRGTESEESIRRRLARAQTELERAGEYHYRVLNDQLDQAVAELHAIVQREFERMSHAG